MRLEEGFLIVKVKSKTKCIIKSHPSLTIICNLYKKSAVLSTTIPLTHAPVIGSHGIPGGQCSHPVTIIGSRSKGKIH